jgi:hypothetical protein
MGINRTPSVNKGADGQYLYLPFDHLLTRIPHPAGEGCGTWPPSRPPNFFGSVRVKEVRSRLLHNFAFTGKKEKIPHKETPSL